MAVQSREVGRRVAAGSRAAKRVDGSPRRATSAKSHDRGHEYVVDLDDDSLKGLHVHSGRTFVHGVTVRRADDEATDRRTYRAVRGSLPQEPGIGQNAKITYDCNYDDGGKSTNGEPGVRLGHNTHYAVATHYKDREGAEREGRCARHFVTRNNWALDLQNGTRDDEKRPRRYVTAIRGRATDGSLERLQFVVFDAEDGLTYHQKDCGGCVGDWFEIVAPPGEFIRGLKVRLGRPFDDPEYMSPDDGYVTGIADVAFGELPSAAAQQEARASIGARVKQSLDEKLPFVSSWLNITSEELEFFHRWRTGDTSHEEDLDATTLLWGILLFGFAVAAVNINERRAVKQDILNEYCEAVVISAHGSKSRGLGPVTDETELHNAAVHAHGMLVPKPTWPTDEGLGVEGRHQLRMKRTVEMYQWIETEHEEKDKDGKVTRKWHEYHKAWADSYQYVEHSITKQNPSFPHLPGRERQEPDRIVMDCDDGYLHLKLSNEFTDRLDNYKSCAVDTVDGGRRAEQALTGLKLDDGKLYKGTGWFGSEAIGDVRVYYHGVPDGKFTALGKYHPIDGITTMNASLKETLRDEAPLAMPWTRAEGVAGKPGMLSTLKTAPKLATRRIELAAAATAGAAESWVMTMAPLQWRYFERGVLSKHKAFDIVQARCEQHTTIIFGACYLLLLWGMLCMDPATCLQHRAEHINPVATAVSAPLAWVTRRRALKKANMMRHRGARRTGWQGGADIVFDGQHQGAPERSRERGVGPLDSATPQVTQQTVRMAEDGVKRLRAGVLRRLLSRFSR